MPEAEKEKTMTDTSGPTSGRQFATYDPSTRSWKTSGDTEASDSTAYSETWPKTGYMHDGRAYELPTPGHRTIEKGSSSWLPTPTATDWKRDNFPSCQKRKSPPLPAVDTHFPRQQFLPTSNAYSGLAGGGQHPDKRRAGGHSVGINDAAMAMGDSAEKFPPYGRYAQVVHWWEEKFTPAPYPVEVGARGKYRLNTEFAEWMMGLPAGWVTSDEIGLSRKDQLKAIGNGVCPQQATLALERLFGGDVPA